MFPVQPLTRAGEGERSIFVFGLGYTGLELALQLRQDGWKICGTCRSLEKKKVLAEKYGLKAYDFDSSKRLRGAGLEALSQATHLLSCVPPDPDFCVDSVLQQHFNDIESSEYLRWIGYISSTGVYGDHRGAFVNESSQTNPVDKKGRARLAAEKRWLELRGNASVQIFRLGGIYGPGRSILDWIGKQATELSKQQLARDKRLFISRIHVADVCRVLTASIQSPCSGRIYNVVDDNPAPRSEVAAFARQLVRIEVDEEEEVHSGGAPAEKRVENKRIKDELNVQLLYPSYVDGYSSIYKQRPQCYRIVSWNQAKRFYSVRNSNTTRYEKTI